MTNSNLTNGSISFKAAEYQSSLNSLHERKSEDRKPEMEVRNINDALRLLFVIYKAEKSDCIKDLTLFCKEAFIFFQYEKLSAENQKGLDDCLRDKKSMKDFMKDVRNFLFSLIYGISKN